MSIIRKTERETDNFTIEKNVPMPARMPRNVVYPFGKMKVGDSFAIPDLESLNRIRSASAQYRRRHNHEVTFHISKEHMRIWRIK